MRISYKNLAALTGATLSATNQNNNFPVENIISNYLELPFKSTGNTANITIEFDSDYNINHIAWGYHNLTALTVRYLDNLDVEISNTVITLDQGRAQDCQFHYENVSNVRKVVFEMTTTDPTIYIGGISAGTYFQFPDFQATPETPYQLRGNARESGSGQTSGRKLRNTRLYNYSFKFTTEQEYSDIEQVLDYVGRSKAHFVDVYPGNTAAIVHRPFWGRIEPTGDAGRKEFMNDFQMFFTLSYRRVY